MYAVGLVSDRGRSTERAPGGGPIQDGEQSLTARDGRRSGEAPPFAAGALGVLAPRPADEGAVGGPARSRRWRAGPVKSPSSIPVARPIQDVPRSRIGASRLHRYSWQGVRRTHGERPVARDCAKGFRGQSPGPARIGLRGRSMSAIESGDHHPLIHETPRPPERDLAFSTFRSAGDFGRLELAWWASKISAPPYEWPTSVELRVFEVPVPIPAPTTTSRIASYCRLPTSCGSLPPGPNPTFDAESWNTSSPANFRRSVTTNGVS